MYATKILQKLTFAINLDKNESTISIDYQYTRSKNGQKSMC